MEFKIHKPEHSSSLVKNKADSALSAGFAVVAKEKFDLSLPHVTLAQCHVDMVKL